MPEDRRPGALICPWNITSLRIDNVLADASTLKSILLIGKGPLA